MHGLHLAEPCALYAVSASSPCSRSVLSCISENWLPVEVPHASFSRCSHVAFLPPCPQPPQCAGEVLDPVKDQLLSSLASAVSTAPVAMPGSGRAPPRSSLSQLLGTSK